MYVSTMEDCTTIVDNIFRHCEYIYDKKTHRYYIKKGCGFDIETTTYTSGDITTGFCYHWQMAIGQHVIFGRSLEIMKAFLECLIDKINTIETKKGTPRLLVWDANLGYEWQYCKKYWYYLGVSEFFCKEIRNPLKFCLGDCLEFRECIGLFGHSLEDIAKNYCRTQKRVGNLDYNKIRNSYTKMTLDEMHYCKNDVVILKELGEHVFRNYYGNKESLPLTSTGFVRESIKRRIGANLKKVKGEVQSHMPSENDYYLLRQFGFKGGFCGTNGKYWNDIVHNVLCADLVSDYPAQMMHKQYPQGYCAECRNEEFCTENIPYIAMIELNNVRSKTTHSYISSHKCMNRKEFTGRNSIIDNGRIFEAERIIIVINDVEWETVQKMYHIGSAYMIKCWKFDKYGKLPKYITDELMVQYRKKNELKKAGKNDTQEYRDAKAFVNGIFGMCATSIFPFEKQLDGTPDCNVIVSENKKEFDKAIEGMFLSPFYAFWVTSYARDILCDVICKFPDLILQYDTDSIYFRDGVEGSEELKQYLKEYNDHIKSINNAIFDNDEFMEDLGTWEIEKPIARFKGLGAKRYAKQSIDGKYKFVVAGCRKGTIEKQYEATGKYKYNDIMDFFNFNMEIEEKYSDKLASVYIDDEYILEIEDNEGNRQLCNCKSSVVLNPTEFTIGADAQLHADFIKSIKERVENVR